ncbi:1-acyl-sn-glycerol-3-phosphate acyltransferase [Ectothiorhodospiraceae bacterium 2226]|nr:1-acyl-sn-glycerol-3-phosphate acyltransferase [Ectothiorhodospiraceae bacterium 2226]
MAGISLMAVVIGTSGLLTAVLPYRLRYRYLTNWGRFTLWWLRVTCGVNFRVQGMEHLPQEPAVVLAKHQSAWETIALPFLLPPQTWVLKRSLLWIPVFGWGLALLRPIAIDRSAGRRALAQIIERGRRRLEQGIWVVVFPEGTRVAPGTRGRYGIGGAMLAARSGVPVVPVAHNAGEFWPRNGFRKRPGTIELRIGPPIPTAGRSAQEVNAAAEAWIEDTMAVLADGGGASAPEAELAKF